MGLLVVDAVVLAIAQAMMYCCDGVMECFG
jgi:hypothetical protein